MKSSVGAAGPVSHSGHAAAPTAGPLATNTTASIADDAAADAAEWDCVQVVRWLRASALDEFVPSVERMQLCGSQLLLLNTSSIKLLGDFDRPSRKRFLELVNKLKKHHRRVAKHHGGMRGRISTMMMGKKNGAHSEHHDRPSESAGEASLAASTTASTTDALPETASNHTVPSAKSMESTQHATTHSPSLSSSSATGVPNQRASVGSIIYSEAELAHSSENHRDDDTVALALLAMLPAPSREMLYAVAEKPSGTRDYSSGTYAMAREKPSDDARDRDDRSRGSSATMARAPDSASHLYEYEELEPVTTSQRVAVSSGQDNPSTSTPPASASTSVGSATHVDKAPPEAKAQLLAGSKSLASVRTSALFEQQKQQQQQQRLHDSFERDAADDCYDVPETASKTATRVSGAGVASAHESSSDTIELYAVPESEVKTTTAISSSSSSVGIPGVVTAPPSVPPVTDGGGNDVYEVPEIVINTNTSHAAMAARVGCKDGIDASDSTTELYAIPESSGDGGGGGDAAAVESHASFHSVNDHDHHHSPSSLSGPPKSSLNAEAKERIAQRLRDAMARLSDESFTDTDGDANGGAARVGTAAFATWLNSSDGTHSDSSDSDSGESWESWDDEDESPPPPLPPKSSALLKASAGHSAGALSDSAPPAPTSPQRHDVGSGSSGSRIKNRTRRKKTFKVAGGAPARVLSPPSQVSSMMPSTNTEGTRRKRSMPSVPTRRSSGASRKSSSDLRTEEIETPTEATGATRETAVLNSVKGIGKRRMPTPPRHSQATGATHETAVVNTVKGIGKRRMPTPPRHSRSSIESATSPHGHDGDNDGSDATTAMSAPKMSAAERDRERRRREREAANKRAEARRAKAVANAAASQSVAPSAPQPAPQPAVVPAVSSNATAATAEEGVYDQTTLVGYKERCDARFNEMFHAAPPSETAPVRSIAKATANCTTAEATAISSTAEATAISSTAAARGTTVTAVRPAHPLPTSSSVSETRHSHAVAVGHDYRAPTEVLSQSSPRATRRGEPVPVQHDYAKFDPRTQHHPPAIAAHDYRVPDRVDGGTAVAPHSVGSISGVASTGVAMGGGGRPVVNDYRVAHHHPAVDTRHPPSAVRGFDYRVPAEEIPGHSVSKQADYAVSRAAPDTTDVAPPLLMPRGEVVPCRRVDAVPPVVSRGAPPPGRVEPPPPPVPPRWHRERYYLGPFSREKAEEALLADGREGVFLVRCTTNAPEPVLSFLFAGEVRHSRIRTSHSGKFYMGDAKSLLFDTVQGLIAHHSAPGGTLKCVCNQPS